MSTQTAQRQEIKIVEIRSRMQANEKPVKQFIGYDNQYCYPVTYVLEDGQEIESYNHKKLLRDAKKEIESMPYSPKNMKASFNDGKFWGTVSSYSLF